MTKKLRRVSLAQKQSVCRQAKQLAPSHTQAQIARKLGVSTASLYRWQQEFKDTALPTGPMAPVIVHDLQKSPMDATKHSSPTGKLKRVIVRKAATQAPTGNNERVIVLMTNTDNLAGVLLALRE
jgi:transposase-like protein